MREINFTYYYHSNEHRIKTMQEWFEDNLCPFLEDTNVNSLDCELCRNNCGRLKNRTAILCDRDEEISPGLFSKILLVELR